MTTVALRCQALFLDVRRDDAGLSAAATVPVLAFLARLRDAGFTVSEELLRALSAVPAGQLAEVAAVVGSVMGVELNWAPLVKGWDVPTGETRADHLVTWIANLFGPGAGIQGTTLPCGHLIPDGTFPLERYNGCPFCGTPFQTARYVHRGQGSSLKELRLFTAADLQRVFTSLLASATPLDATQTDSLGLLLREFPLPAGVAVPMRETAMLVVSRLAELGRADEATPLLSSPADILRYLWYRKTGHLQVIAPRTLVAHAARLHRHHWQSADRSADAAASMRQQLRLHYSRSECRQAARWLNAVPMTAPQAAENMNPRRGMWVRLIRALRLAEYAQKSGYGHLADILDAFYRHDYTTWQGSVDQAGDGGDVDRVLALLSQRPGLFARSLFATMLRFGPDRVLAAFDAVADRLPSRLLISLGNAAEAYFDPQATRLARPVTGGVYPLQPHRLLARYSDADRQAMVRAVADLYSRSMSRRFAAQPTTAKTIYIDPALNTVPVGVGDRSATVHDVSAALMGTRFPVSGDAVRLFLQWGRGLPAQHLDMDLSCRVALPGGQQAECAYYSLTCVGARHSGDIQSIPDMVGTAEYIELSLPELQAAGAVYVTFTCNAYTGGALAPNLVVGWMDSAYPMTVSKETGVAYDPSCVQHMVRITEGNLSKGLVFGVLDVARREIVWLEMPFTAQTLKGADSASVEALLRRLDAKLKIGQLLRLKAEAQHLTVVERADEADEVYTYQWALNPAEWLHD